MFSCLISNVNGDVLATFRVVFKVSRVHQYSDSFVQDLLRAGLSSAMHGKPLEVPGYGEINSIILLGSEPIQSSFNYPRPCSSMKAVGVINWFALCSHGLLSLCLLGASGKSFYVIGDEMIGE